VNLSNASSSLIKHLPLTETQYSSCASILFLGYIVFEIPSNLTLKKVSARTWFSRIMISWGLVSFLQAWVKNYEGLMVCRVFLGACEAGLFPGLTFFVTRWYTRRERAFMLAFILCMQSLSGMVGGLIAYGALQLEGRRGLHGWSWIFIVEGAPTIAFGIIVYWLITESPDEAKWLTDEEKQYLKERVKAPPNTPINWRELYSAFIDPKLIVWTLCQTCYIANLYALSYFNVPVLQTFTKDALVANALSVPIYFVAFVLTLIVARLADVHQNYCGYLVFSGLLSGIGFLMLGIALRGYGNNSFGFKYVSLITATAGALSGLPNGIAWITVGLVGETKTATGVAFVISAASVSGIFTPYIFSSSQVRTGSYSDGSFGMMGISFLGVILAILIQCIWPLDQTLKEAEAEDYATGYGKTLRNLAKKFSRLGSRKTPSRNDV